MQYLTYLLPLAALAVANPLERRGCANNACLAAVTGTAALGDGKLRASHCASFLVTSVTPAAVTVTTTVTGKPSKGAWKRDSVTVCPNDVPNYASACDESGYSSACSCFGFTEVKTTTIPATTTYKTVYVDATCTAGSTVTVTSAKATVTETATVTKTETKTPTGPSGLPDYPGKCLSDAEAEKIVNNFRTLLEFTSYNGSRGGAPGRGYQFNVSAATLDESFVDISDSINFMAGFPLGGITFKDKKAFDLGQGFGQPEVTTETLNIWHGCRDITWRWKVTPHTPVPYPVVGINYMQINDKGLIYKQYAEFDNGAWLQSFPGGPKCAVSPIVISPTQALRRRHY